MFVCTKKESKTGEEGKTANFWMPYTELLQSKSESSKHNMGFKSCEAQCWLHRLRQSKLQCSSFHSRMQQRETVRLVPRSPQVDKKGIENDEVKVWAQPFGLDERILELSLAQFQNRKKFVVQGYLSQY
ncbi:hypothetical protein MBANPS3_012604 [Mucor bainieri]